MLPLALIAGAAIGAGQIAYGAHQKKKAQEAAAANVMPEYKIAPEEQQMLSAAESQAGSGMSDAAAEALRANSDRAQGTSIDAILRGGGNVNAIGNLASKTQSGLNQLAIYDDQARLQKLQELQTARARMSANRDKSYQINEYNPWANKSQAIAQQLAGGQNMMMSGINTLGQGILGGLGSIGGQPKTPDYNYIPSSPSMGSMPIGQGAGSQPYTPSGVSVPPFEMQGQPFGMMNEGIDNTRPAPVWNGYSWT